ncbi:MAG: hypothetical protein Q7S02_04890 [bacterium]|nr:hypothetical protein [bacterium]
MTTSTRNWWIGGAVVVVLIALITWAGTKEEPQQAVVGTSVVVLSPSASASAGGPTPMTWEVRAPVGSTATHTAVHWGATSNSGALGTDVTPAASGYPNLLPDYAEGSYALPRNFTGAATFPTAGTYYYRGHAIIGGLHYWSPEYTIQIE